MKELLPDHFRLKWTAADEFGRHVLFDKGLCRLSAHLMVSDAKSLQTLVCCDSDDRVPDGLDFTRRVGKATFNRCGNKMDFYFADLVFCHCFLALITGVAGHHRFDLG